MSVWPVFIILTGIAYLAGAVPFGVILGRMKGIDIQKTGSGNTGTSNAIRALGPVWGGAVFLGDTLKGFLPTLLAVSMLQRYGVTPRENIIIACIIGIMTVIGHNYSIFLRFRGGKGIATSFGVFLALTPKTAILSFILWLLIVATTRISSVASLSASLTLPILTFLFKSPPELLIFTILFCLLAFYTHRENIRRLIRGEERRMIGENRENNNNDGKNADSTDPAGQGPI